MAKSGESCDNIVMRGCPQENGIMNELAMHVM
jgi:hypothetical protein